jgi:hypothetical protein
MAYENNKCWHGKSQKNPDSICGMPGALLYRVEKPSGGISVKDNRTQGPRSYMFLCLQHVKRMEKSGYVCTVQR